MNFKKLESSKIFWITLVVSLITLFSFIFVKSFTFLTFWFLPVGILMLFGIKPEGFIIVPTIIAWYGIIGFSIYKITTDKKISTKLIIFLILFILLTMYGCTSGGLQ